MSTPAWPSSLSTVLTSGYSVKEPGLIGWWSNNTLPAYPDNVAGTSYSQDAWLNVDGWGGNATAPNVTDLPGSLTAKPNGIYKATLVPAGKLICVRIKSTTAQNIAFTSSVIGTFYTASTTTDWQVFSFYADGTYTGYIIIGAGTSYDFYIDWIYVGTGLYDTPILDNSGAVSGIGNLISYGSVPVTGLSGNAIFRNGVNSYERSAAVVSSVPDVWHYHESFPFGHAQQSYAQMLLNYKNDSATVGYWWCYRYTSSDSLYIDYATGLAIHRFSIASFFTGFSSVRIDIDIEMDWVNAVAKIWRNGTLITTQNLTTPVKPLAGNYLYFGALEGTNYFCYGTSDERRLYGRALSDAEVYSLYSGLTTYEALPDAPLNSSYSDTTVSGVLRSSMDIGIAKQRRRYTAEVRTLAAQFFLDKYQKQILEQFYDDTLVGGTLDFTWTEPITGEALVCRFPGKRPAFSALEYGFIASCEFEILP